VEIRLGRRTLAVPALAAALAVGAGAVGFHLSREADRDRDRQAFLRRLAPAQLAFADAVDAGIEGFGQVDPDTAAEAQANGPGLDRVLQVGPAGAGLSLAGGAGALRALQPVLDTARDSGTLRASPPVVLAGDSDPVVLLLLPRYAAGAATGTTAARRGALVGFAVGVLNPAAAGERFLRSVTDAGGGLAVTDGGRELYRAGGSVGDGADTIRSRIDVPGRSWTIAAEPDLGGTGVGPWVSLGAGLLIGLAMLSTARYLRGVERQTAGAARDREVDLATIAGVAPILQQSLELADVLPAASAFLADRFALSGVSVAYVGDDSDLVEAFTVGRRPPDIPRRPADLQPTQVEVRAGEPVAIPLLRGGRIVGAVHGLAGVHLSRERTRTLIAVAEMIGTAVANARQFEREQETVRQLEELDRLKTEFLGTVSHELRTPITAILGFSAILNEEYDDISPDQRRDFLARMARNATSLSALVQGLLDFSRIGRPSFELHPDDIDLSEVTSRILDQLASLLDKHHLVVDAPPGVWAFADPEAVERVVSNLVSNAAKFSPQGSMITVTLRHHHDGASVVVDDGGPGVAEEDRPHIFRRFYRGSSAAAMGTRGAGIGLAVVRDLVERMNGDVTVGSAPGGGARFRVELPARPGPAVPPSQRADQGRST